MIKAKFNKIDLRRILDERVKAIDQIIIERFKYVGEAFINHARTNGAYTDQTGNLRSSIGYIVIKDGKKRAGGGFDKLERGQTGKRVGQEFVKELQRKYDTGYVLICVAGMNYAAAVESKGKDVLSGSVPEAKALLRRFFKSFRG